MPRRSLKTRRTTPEEWSERLLEVRKDYRGWVASIIFWEFSPPARGSQDEVPSIEWRTFKMLYCQRDIPENLSEEVLYDECNKLGIKLRRRSGVSRSSQAHTPRGIEGKRAH